MGSDDRWAGGVDDEELARRLAEFLGCDLRSDFRVLFWAMQRLRVVHARKHLDRSGPEPHFTKNEERAIRTGDDVPPRDGAAFAPRVLVAGQGRPPERAMDDANMYLLSVFPAFAEDPLMFAGLERMYGVDKLEVVRLPSSADWDAEKSPRQLATVRERADRRIQRALELLSTPEGRAKVKPPSARELEKAHVWTDELAAVLDGSPVEVVPKDDEPDEPDA